MKKLIVAIVAICTLSAAQASFLIEPYLGMHFNADAERGGFEDDFSGVGMGARFGWQNLGLQLGANYKMATLDFDDSDDADYSHFGLFAGYEFPVLIRVWAEYILSSTLDFDSSTKSEFEDASGTTLGFGYTGLPFVAINFEISSLEYGELNGSSISEKLELNSYMLSVSLPFTL